MPSKASKVPEELFDIVLKYLHPRRDDDPFESALARCSLTCRHWAAHIRPLIFRRVVLASEKGARTLLAFVRSPVVVPGPLRDTVRFLEVKMDNISRPWLFYVAALFRDDGLRTVKWMDIYIKGVDNNRESQVTRKKGELLLDIGLPRKLPSAHPILLRNLRLQNLQFRSRASLLHSLVLHSPTSIDCENVQWPKESFIGVPIVHLHRQLSLHAPDSIEVLQCAGVLPFIWSLVTPHPLSHGTTPQLLYIHETQINSVMSIFHLFSDECECRLCGMKRDGRYMLRIHSGVCTY